MRSFGCRPGSGRQFAALCEGATRISYQDQTLGALVTARVEPSGVTRSQELDPSWTAALHTAIACPVVLDLSARGGPLRVALRAR